MSFFETALAGVVIAGMAGLASLFSHDREADRKRQARQEQRQSLTQQNNTEWEQLRQRYERSEQQNRQQMEELERQYQQENTAIRNLHSELRRQEQQHSQRIRQIQQQQDRERQQMQERLSRESQKLRDAITHVRTEMEQLSAQTQEQFAAAQVQHRQDMLMTKEEIQNIRRHTDQLEQQIAKEKEQQRILAEYWIAQAQRIAADIRENCRPEKFEPQKWHGIQQEIANAQSDFQTEIFQTAVGSGRSAFQAASELRDSLIEQELEWQKHLETARQMQIRLLQELEEAETRSYQFELDGQPTEDHRGVDYWTYGQLSVLVQRIEETSSRLSTSTEELTTEQLAELTQELHTLSVELAMLENAAAVNLTMANERYQMAVRIGEVLGDSFLMDEQDGDYFASENRDEYHASFTNPDTGEQAVVVITPLLGNDGVVTNHAEVLVRTPDNNPDYRKEVNHAVVQNISRDIPDFQLPCSEQYAEHTNEEAERLGNISAVSEGMETVRSQCSLSGVDYHNRTVKNPAVSGRKK